MNRIAGKMPRLRNLTSIRGAQDRLDLRRLDLRRLDLLRLVLHRTALVPLLPLLACSPPEMAREAFADLVVEAPYAEILVEPYELGVGAAQGRQYLGGGWSTRDESDGHGTFVWAVGESSTLRLPILERRDLEVEIELRPFAWPGSPGQSVSIFLGKEELARFDLTAGPSVIRFDIAGDLQDAESNELSLRWAWSRTPKDVLGASDQRSLAAAVYGVRFPGFEERSGEAPRAEGERLWLPAGSRIDYFFDLPEGSVLSIEEVGLRGPARAQVEVLAESSETGPVSSDRSPSARPLKAGQNDLPPGLVRLRIAAAGASGGVRLQRPFIKAPAREDASDETAGPATGHGAEDSETAGDLEPEGPETRPSIVLYSIDTLRADALDLYGGPVPAPSLRQFARGAWLFEDATAQSSWTKASMASVLTGLLPTAHGALSRRHVLGPERVTLQELLSAAGYQTAAFNTNPNLTATFGFDQGFDAFFDLPEEATAAEVVEQVEAWLLSERDQSRPLFLWVHTLDPHSPYAPPAEARERWAGKVAPEVAASSLRLLDDMRAGRIPRDQNLLDDLRTLYHAEAAYSDETFGHFLSLLEAQGLGGAAMLVLSDHGEEFFEHGNLEHGRALYEESVHVPLMLRLPGGAAAAGSGGHSGEAVQHIDVLPTLLEIAGLSVPEILPGRSLFAEGERDLFIHLHLDGAERAGIIRGRHKLLTERGRDGRLGRFRLYDLSQDAAEKINLALEQPVRRGVLAQALRRSLANATAAPEIDLDPEMRRRLEALGYL